MKTIIFRSIDVEWNPYANAGGGTCGVTIFALLSSRNINRSDKKYFSDAIVSNTEYHSTAPGNTIMFSPAVEHRIGLIIIKRDDSNAFSIIICRRSYDGRKTDGLSRVDKRSSRTRRFRFYTIIRWFWGVMDVRV